jgi:hypothetical protein
VREAEVVTATRLDLGEKVLDQVARRIKLSVIVARRGPVGSWRDRQRLRTLRRRRTPCRRSACRLPWWAAGGPPPPRRVPRRRSGNQQIGAPRVTGCGIHDRRTAHFDPA